MPMRGWSPWQLWERMEIAKRGAATGSGAQKTNTSHVLRLKAESFVVRPGRKTLASRCTSPDWEPGGVALQAEEASVPNRSKISPKSNNGMDPQKKMKVKQFSPDC